MEELIEKLEELHTLAKEIRASVKDADGKLLRDQQVNCSSIPSSKPELARVLR